MLLVLDKIATAINMTGFEKIYPQPNKLHPGAWDIVVEYRDDLGKKQTHTLTTRDAQETLNLSREIISQVRFLLDLQTTEAVEEALRKAIDG